MYTTLTTAQNALKTLYLGVLANQLNVSANPLLTKIEQTSENVVGNEIKKLAPYGISGGIAACDETGTLPDGRGNLYAQFTLSLKNIFGVIDLSDKAILASKNSSGAFVSLLNAEMESLLKSSKYNLSRMLFSDGSGILGTVQQQAIPTNNMADVYVDSVKNFIEGQGLSLSNSQNSFSTVCSAMQVLAVDRVNNMLKLQGVYGAISANSRLGARNINSAYELTGIEALFNDSATLYGLARADYSFMNPYKKAVNAALDTGTLQETMDFVEERAGGLINYIVTTYAVRRAYVEYLSLNRTNLDYMNLDGGFKALSYSGIPFVADKFVHDGVLYMLNSDDFKMHQLCDWRWMDGENGTILQKITEKAAYRATLVKYADVLCAKPMGQAKLTGLTAYTAPSTTVNVTCTPEVTVNCTCDQNAGSGEGGV